MKSLLSLCLLVSSAIIVCGNSQNKYVELQNGYQMPILGLGTWQATDNSLEQAVDAALEAGYRHIDTAAAYQNEEIIGRVLSRWFSAGKLNRSELFVVTKLPRVGMRAQDVPIFLKQSLQKLQLDFIDMYLIHNPIGYQNLGDGKLDPKTPDGGIAFDPTTDHVAIWKAMEEQVDAGLAKSIGLSNFNETQIARILNICRIPPTNLQVEFHAYFQQKPLVEFCRNNNIAVTAYSPLGTPGTTKVATPNLLGDSVVQEIAVKHNKSPAQVLIRFIVQRGIICIPKSTTPSRIQQNINIFDFELDEQDIEKLNGLDKGKAGRIIDFTYVKGTKDHPEYPFY